MSSGVLGQVGVDVMHPVARVSSVGVAIVLRESGPIVRHSEEEEEATKGIMIRKDAPTQPSVRGIEKTMSCYCLHRSRGSK